jgi:hypothetical protein
LQALQLFARQQAGGAGVSGGDLQQSLDGVAKAHAADVAAEDQLSLLDPVSAEEMVQAREELGSEAGTMTLLRHAREKRRGRPLGAKNKRTDDLAKYLLQFGEDPLVGAMRLATTSPEVLIEASRREFIKLVTLGKGDNRRTEKHVWLAPTMTYGDAQALIMRARELIAPYIHGKKPVAIVHDFSGLKDLVIEGVTHNREEVKDIVDADFIAIEDMRDDGGEE